MNSGGGTRRARLALFALAALAAQGQAVRDRFESLKAWQAVPSDGVALALERGAGPEGASLRLAFDFQGRAGYAAARRQLPFELPANYEISFWVRGDCPTENLEFKMVDPSGENVWWVQKPAFAFPRAWTRVVLKKRMVAFAWGPGGADPRRMGSLEWCVTAGSGGKGVVEFSDLAIRELPEAHPYDRVPAVSASSGAPRPGAPWSTAEEGGWYQVDFREPRELGGLRLDWADEAPADFRVEVSPDGAAWTPLRQVRGAAGRASHLPLPETETRYLRIACQRTRNGRGWGLRALTVQPLAYGASWNAVLEDLARTSPRGDYPRGFLGEQPYWTLVGVDGGLDSALMGEDGALEAGKGGPSLEPFLYSDGTLLGWNDAVCAQSLERGALPIPTVTRTHGDLKLAITAFGAGEAAAPVIRCRYRLTAGQGPWKGSLFLALRPFQVNPPSQFLGTPGGVVDLGGLAFGPAAAAAGGKTLMTYGTRPDGAGALAFDAGPLLDHLRRGALPPDQAVIDAHPSGALRYDVALAPGETRDILVDLPLGAAAPRPAFEADLREAIRAWEEKLDRVRLDLPEPGAADTVRTCLAHILISRKGPALRPGTRSYARSWIRDGAMMAAALLRLGHAREVRDYLAWYQAGLFPDGKVPCVIDDRGADPVPENDSPGEFLFLAAEYGRFTGDRAFLAGLWPQVRRAAAYLETLLAKEPSGLLPASISHEGYAAKPMHSYWDDYWALRGLKDAAWLAADQGDAALARHFEARAGKLRADVLASLRTTMAAHKIPYLPGCEELGDFDATSTTAALQPGRELPFLPPAAVASTFDTFYAQFQARRKGGRPDDRYTPYETRLIGAFAQLGQPERAAELLRAYLEDRRPLPWNQWPEVVQRGLREPVFLGDLPHAWVGSDYIRSVLAMLVLEEDGALVLGAGLPAAWLAQGVRLEGLRLPGGELSYTARAEGGRVVTTLTGTVPCPPGGFRLRWPLPGTFRRVTVDGQPVEGMSGTAVAIRRLPATVVMEP